MNAPSSIATLRANLNADRRMLRAAVERGALMRVRALIQQAPGPRNLRDDLPPHY